MRESESARSVPFSPVDYSIDTFVPLLDLGEEARFAPGGDRSWGTVQLGGRELRVTGLWFQSYLWIHQLFGFVLTGLIPATLSGLVRRR